MDSRSRGNACEDPRDAHAGHEAGRAERRSSRRARGVHHLAEDGGRSRRRREMSETVVDRRTFLDALLTTGFVSTALAIAYPVTQFIAPPASGEPATESVSAGLAARLRPNAAAIFKFGSRPGIVVRTSDGDIRAFSAVCTHLDCTVQFKSD